MAMVPENKIDQYKFSKIVSLSSTKNVTARDFLWLWLFVKIAI